MILWTSEYPSAETGKGACNRRDSDVAENFAAFNSLPAHLPSLVETAF
jgi:hypothetical protein